MPISRAAAKQKGRALEARTAARTAAWLGVTSGIDENHEVKRTRASGSNDDIELSPRLKKLFPYLLECKNHRTLKIPQWIAQVRAAVARKGDNRTPVIVFREHRSAEGDEWAIVPFEVFLQLATEHLNLLRALGELEEDNNDG